MYRRFANAASTESRRGAGCGAQNCKRALDFVMVRLKADPTDPVVESGFSRTPSRRRGVSRYFPLRSIVTFARAQLAGIASSHTSYVNT